MANIYSTANISITVNLQPNMQKVNKIHIRSIIEYSKIVAKCSTDHVREVIPENHFNYSTEKTYMGWISRFIILHNQRH